MFVSLQHLLVEAFSSIGVFGSHVNLNSFGCWSLLLAEASLCTVCDMVHMSFFALYLTCRNGKTLFWPRYGKEIDRQHCRNTLIQPSWTTLPLFSLVFMRNKIGKTLKCSPQNRSNPISISKIIVIKTKNCPIDSQIVIIAVTWAFTTSLLMSSISTSLLRNFGASLFSAGPIFLNSNFIFLIINNNNF